MSAKFGRVPLFVSLRGMPGRFVLPGENFQQFAQVSCATPKSDRNGITLARM